MNSLPVSVHDIKEVREGNPAHLLLHVGLEPGFRNRIDLMRIRIRIRIQHFFLIADPDPGSGSRV
jgi:hypothetical protein